MSGVKPTLNVSLECEEPPVQEPQGYWLDDLVKQVLRDSDVELREKYNHLKIKAGCLLDAVARHGRENTALSWGGCTLAAIELRKTLEGRDAASRPKDPASA